MIKTRSTLLVFLLIAAQSAIAIIAGVAALYFLSQNSLPAGIRAGEAVIGGMSYPQAARTVETQYAQLFQTKSIRIETEKGSFEIPFSQVNARVDGAATVDVFKSMDAFSGIPSLLQAYFGQAKPVLRPVVKLNGGKLREALLGISGKVSVPPVDANIGYNNGIIEKKAETDGISLNVANAAQRIEKAVGLDPWKPVQFKRAENYELQTVSANRKLKDYEDIQQVLAEYTTDILDEQLTDSIELAADAINGLVLPASVDGKEGEAFSFVEQLLKKDANFENDNEGFDQVASTLYAALLTAGVPADSITRLPHKLAPDYIEPGLDAWISGSAGDLRFTNPFGHKVAIFTQVELGRVKVIIAGYTGDKKENVKITTEVSQKIKPPVYNVENDKLKPGEKIVLNPGREGVVVNVYRNEEFLGTDTYEAEKAIVQIGPGTEWKDDGK